MSAVMIDLETMGTSPNAVILTLGAIKFDPYSLKEPGPGLYFKLDVDAQLKLGRTIDESTLEWWAKQDVAVRDEAFGEDNRTSIHIVLSDLNKFVVGADTIWAQGPIFDIVMLESLMSQMQRPVPWHFYQIRDSRTLFGLGWDPRNEIKTDAHNALADAYYQSVSVQKVYDKLKPVYADIKK